MSNRPLNIRFRPMHVAKRRAQAGPFQIKVKKMKYDIIVAQQVPSSLPLKITDDLQCSTIY